MTRQISCNCGGRGSKWVFDDAGAGAGGRFLCTRCFSKALDAGKLELDDRGRFFRVKKGAKI